jgi:hypothetical protein
LGLLALAVILPAETDAAIGLKIYVDQTQPEVGKRVVYGYDRDAVCTRGLCDDGTTSCLSNANCTGIGGGTCNYTTCVADFNMCDDNTTICADNADCTGIGTGTCNTNPCNPPNENCGVKVEDMTSGAPVEQTIWELVCDPVTLPSGTDCQTGVALPGTTVSWDFSHFNTTTYSDLSGTASTFQVIDTVEFAPGGDNSGDCGFNPGGAHPERSLNREDKNPSDMVNFVPTLQSNERVDGVMVCDDGSICTASSPDCDGIGDGICKDNATIWLYATVRYDGIEGAALGEGESRLCMTDDDGTDRTEVPLWRFPNLDADGYYMELGDPRWTHTVFDCEPIVQAPAVVNARADNPDFEGRQSGEVVNEGLVKLPSGHQFKALVVRSVVEYDVAINFIIQCALDVDDVRTVIYMWQVPHLGTVTRLQSDKVAPDLHTFTHLSEVDVKFGLFPPLTLNAGPVTGSTIDVSWNPGDITTHIDDYRVYWGQESGGACSIGGEDCTDDHPGAGVCSAGKTCCSSVGAVCNSYERDSVNDPGMITFNSGCTLAPGDTECATIDSLDPGTTYYVTVTSRDAFVNPSSSVTTTYESLLYPTQVPAHPVDLPIEVSATTSGGADAGAVPDGDDRPGTQLTASRSGNMVTLSWGTSCLAGDTDYGVYEGALGSGNLAQVTCSTGNQTSWGPFLPEAGDRFFVVVPSNGTAEGSYGLDSSGVERAVSSNACRPQSIGVPVCP